MKVRFTEQFKSVEKGTVVDVSEQLATELIEKGVATADTYKKAKPVKRKRIKE